MIPECLAEHHQRQATSIFDFRVDNHSICWCSCSNITIPRRIPGAFAIAAANIELNPLLELLSLQLLWAKVLYGLTCGTERFCCSLAPYSKTYLRPAVSCLFFSLLCLEKIHRIASNELVDLVGNALNQFSMNKAKERREQGLRPLTAKAFVKLANKYFEELPEDETIVVPYKGGIYQCQLSFQKNHLIVLTQRRSDECESNSSRDVRWCYIRW